MDPLFKVLSTNSFDRSLKKLVRKDSKIVKIYTKILDVLESDPLNLSKQHQIKKLTNIENGQWRIRVGVYRLRYDIFKKTVILHSINHRGNAYRD